jgi:hypothetical protein
MYSFFVRIKPDFDRTNIVHKKGCPLMPEIDNRIPLGRFLHSKKAMKEANRYFLRVNGCYFCNKECYKPSDKLLYQTFKEIIYN